MDNLAAIEAEMLTTIATAPDMVTLEAARVASLGRHGSITQAMKKLSELDPEARRIVGRRLNQVKDAVGAAIEERRSRLAQAALEAQLDAERVDVTLPVRPASAGSLHPTSRTVDEIVEIFGTMGFSVAEGPDVEDDFHNYTALNFPVGHPAREMHDTFYFPEQSDGSRLLLRTHTSPVQVRTMRTQTPPIRIIAPGRAYRSDLDQTHTPMFHQVEGLMIGEDIHMGHLRGCLSQFLAAYFELDDLPLRFRPSFFPFTEPSAEVDILCDRSGGGLKIGTGQDWLEILGCGMVHPNVLKFCGLDPARYQGFAFGMGIERIAMLKYGIPDLRTFFGGDIRWLEHYGFRPFDIPSLISGRD